MAAKDYSDWTNVSAAIYANTHEEMDQVYTNFASSYDDTLEKLGAAGNESMVKVALQFIPHDESALMLDVAAGTGLASEYSRSLGFKGEIDGLEMNAAMLNEAITKGIYRKTYCFTVSDKEPLPVSDGTYDVLIVGGAFILNHLPQGCVVYLVKALKPGGFLVFNSRNVEENREYREVLMRHLNQLVDEKKIVLVKREEIPYTRKACAETGKAMTAFAYIYMKL